ncbi:acyl CoA binding protein-domain-containing protein [Chlamydoabsidia padenii]|nr:acyl CoA binding protein-domain-containing protein [Chlamydoabsidia padenii]
MGLHTFQHWSFKSLMPILPHIIQSRFNRALAVVHSLPQDETGLRPIPTDRLKFYGLYKQATVGECNTPKPSSRKVVDYAKWKAWYRVRQLDRLEAQNLYVNALVELLVEFIHRYPSNPYVDFAKEALQSLETDIPAGSEEGKQEKTTKRSNPFLQLITTTQNHMHGITLWNLSIH